MTTLIPDVTPETLFYKIFEISRINRELGKRIFLQAKDNLPSLFVSKPSFYSLIQKIMVSEPSSFKNWFIANSEPNKVGKQDIEAFTYEMLSAIGECDSDFHACRNTAEINTLKANRLMRLQYLPFEFSRRPGFALPLHIEKISKALDGKVTEVTRNAKQREEFLIKLNEDYLDSIHLDEVLFSNC